MPLPRKTKIFGWRCYHQALAVGSNLYILNLRKCFSCPFCHYVIEIEDHLFLKCWLSKAVWEGINVQKWDVVQKCNNLADVIYFCCTKLTVHQAALCLVGLWYMWYVRNKVKHSKLSFTPNEVTYRIVSLTAEYMKACKDVTGSLLSYSDFVWKPPPPGLIKIICDATWDAAGSKGSVGIIARDHEGRALSMRAKHSIYCRTSFESEGVGVLEGIKLAKDLKAGRVIFESDCSEVVQRLVRIDIAPGEQTQWYIRCLEELDKHPGWSIVTIQREANDAADRIAKNSRSNNWSWDTLNAIPLIPF
ncbi:hypothetical protein QQ045_020525 [Rhodiola kirilowii]